MNEITQAQQQAAVLSFITKHKLETLQKRLKSLNNDALKVFEDVLHDPETDIKIKMDAAKWISKMYVEVTDAITKDQFNRLMAEVKVNGPQRPALKDVEGEALAPKAMFTTEILDVDKLDGEEQDKETFDASGWDTSKIKSK